MTDKDLIKVELRKKLNPKNVKKRPDSGMSYIEGWHAEAEANEIFNFEWDSEILSMVENTPPTKNAKGNNVVSFRAIVRVYTPLGFKDGCGYGSGINKDIHAAYEGAIKEAETDAEKRALKKYGNRFGLALYDKTQVNVGIDKVEPTPEEKTKAAEKWVNDYLVKLDKIEDVDVDLVVFQSENSAMLKRIAAGYANLHDTIVKATNKKRGIIPSPSSLE